MQLVIPEDPDYPTLEIDEQFLRGLVETYGIEAANNILKDRNRKIRLAKEDPLSYGIPNEPWRDAEDLLKGFVRYNNDGDALMSFDPVDSMTILGGNRSSKSRWCSKYCVDTLVNGLPWLPEDERKERNHDLNVAFLHSSAQSSILQQQALVYEFLPPQLRDIGKIKGDKNTNINYNRKNGFTDNILITPDNNLGVFFNYMQDVKVLEGYEFDLVWADELIPKDFVEALKFRLASRSGKFLISFTPVTGFTPVVRDLTSGDTVVESRPADEQLFPSLVGSDGKLGTLVEGVKKGHMPYICTNSLRNSATIYFHSNMNPFSPYKQIVNKCKGRSSPEVKMRAYGYTNSLDGGAFPRFGKEHILSHKAWLEQKKLGGYNFCVADPGGNKNWFIIWARVTPQGDVIVYREWPDFGSYGEWALPSDKVDYKAGPAQRMESGASCATYKKLILELEGGVYDHDRHEWDYSNSEEIEQRIIDPRFCKQAPGGEGSSILDLMLEEDIGHEGYVITPAMYWYQATGGGMRGGMTETDIGIQRINNLLDWNPEEKLSVLNKPNLYVHENCKQTIFALQEYSGMGTDKCALKDPVDTLRYLVGTADNYLGSGSMECISGGSY